MKKKERLLSHVSRPLSPFWLAVLASLFCLLPARAEDAALLKVERAWVAPTDALGGDAAVYMTLIAPGGPVTAVRVESPQANHALFHRSVYAYPNPMAPGQGGPPVLLSMRRLKVLQIAAGKSELTPTSSNHIMLVGLHGELKKGATVPLLLTVLRGRVQQQIMVEARVWPQKPGVF